MAEQDKTSNDNLPVLEEEPHYFRLIFIIYLVNIFLEMTIS